MASLFSSPPQPNMPPPPPQISQAMVAANQADALLKQKRGVGTTVLTSENGLADLGSTKAASPVGTK